MVADRAAGKRAYSSAGPGWCGEEAVRSDIELTRVRMSQTIDEIEAVLLRKKERIEHRLDIFRVVRERPFLAVRTVFGAGLLLGGARTPAAG